MAEIDSNPVPFAEGVVQSCHGWCRAYEGKADALIAAGVLTPELLPGAPGQYKTTARGELNGRKVRVRRALRGRLAVLHEYTEEESEALSAGWQRERDEQVAAMRIAAMPRTPDAYRRHALAQAAVLMRSAGALTAPRGGFAFDANTAEAIGDLLAEVFEVIEKAPVSYSQAARLVEEASVRAEALGDC